MLIDSSLSQSQFYFQKQLDYVTNIVNRISIADDKFKVAIISYSDQAYVDVPFDSNINKTELLTHIQNITIKNGTTHIEAGCQAVENILTVSADAAQYVFLLTDGMPTKLAEAQKGVSTLRQYLANSSSFNEVFVIAFGQDVRHEGLRQLSVDPYFYGDIYDSVTMDPYYKMLKRLVHEDCSGRHFK